MLHYRPLGQPIFHWTTTKSANIDNRVHDELVYSLQRPLSRPPPQVPLILPVKEGFVFVYALSQEIAGLGDDFFVYHAQGSEATRRL
jgi:hypothetical protein